MKLNISCSALKAINILENAGFEAFCVGGAIRDILRGIEPTDYDIATNAKPKEIISLFPKCIETGVKHGTVTAIVDNSALEITTYRSDGIYTDSRHPRKVEFIKSIEEDLSRRDFTINAIAYSPRNGLIDPFNGVEDIESKIIKCVGNAEKRFSEDALRIMRCFRFAATIGFDIEEKTMAASISQRSNLLNISRERIFAELTKMLIGNHLKCCYPLLESPKLAEISLLPPNVYLRFAAWCIASGRDPAETAAALKASNNFIKTINSVMDCVEFDHTNLIELRGRYARWGETVLKDGLSIKAKILGQDTASTFRQIEDLRNLRLPHSVSDLNISGRDIAELGFTGADIGRILQELYTQVLQDPTQNIREQLIKAAQNFRQ